MKCGYCEASTPTGQIGCWRCDYEDDEMERYEQCMKAVERMIEYNEIRATGSITVLSPHNKTTF